MKSKWDANCECRDDMGNRRGDRMVGRLSNGDEMILKITCSICGAEWSQEFISDEEAAELQK